MSRRLLASYLTLAVVVLVLLEVPLGISYARNQRSSTLARLERDAVSVGSFAEDTLQHGGNPGPLRALVRRYGDEADGGVLVLNRTGGLVAASGEEGAGALASGPELRRALGGRVQTGLAGGWLYAAVPVSSGGVVHGAVRISSRLSDVDARIRTYALRLLALSAAVLGLVTIVGLVLSRSVARPLRALAQAARRAGRGELESRASERDGPPEVREVARAFNDMVGRLSDLITVQEAFVADASHELRTPLTALRLRLENGDVDGALTEVERLSRLIDSLLSLARAEATAAEPVDLAGLVEERLEAWEPVAAGRGIRLEDDVRGTAFAGRDRLGQVLDNLLANAIAAAPPGSAVTVTGDESGLHVCDRGPGMSEEERARAFDRFWSKGSGSGLGLPVARRLVEVDGGAIDLLPRLDGGLDVVLRLRAEKPHPGSVEPPTARPRVDATVGTSRRKEVRGVQDDHLGD